ncbi:MAG TPA: metal ABC transporter permease [Bdellovibrionota bacterium]|jgi:manganese/zinc/iron transport system permease protein|nr:metal ABC transporter permease [Bdellovibrionota bacterium]
MNRDYWTIFFAAQLCALLCSVLGVYLNMRRQSMLVDVLSHSALPGVVLAYVIFAGYSAIGVSLGAALCAFVSVLAIEKLGSSRGRIKPDASMAVIFTSMFALGMLLIAYFAERTHIDVQCALFGELLFSPFWGDLSFGGLLIPTVLARLLVAGVVVFGVLRLVHGRLLAASFWGEGAALMGISPRGMTHVLAFLASLTVMVSFELVGVVLVIALFSIPPAFGRLWASSWRGMMIGAAVFAFVSTALGLAAGWWSGLNLGGTIASSQLLLFLASFVVHKLRYRLRRPVEALHGG